jgi:hypothetical protein
MFICWKSKRGTLMSGQVKYLNRAPVMITGSNRRIPVGWRGTMLMFQQDGRLQPCSSAVEKSCAAASAHGTT